MKNKQTTISKATALCSAAMILAAFTLNNVAQAAVVCYEVVAGGTGCQGGYGCPWWEPNVGIVWTNAVQCTYDSGNNLIGQQLSGLCLSGPNGGCCNFIDTSKHCPQANGNLCPSTPGCLATPVGPGTGG